MGKISRMPVAEPQERPRDVLTEILQQGARRLLAQAAGVEVEVFIAQYRELQDDRGRQRVVRNGHLPEREVQTGIGPVAVKVPRVRDRQPDAESGPIRFSSKIVPPYLRRSRSLEELLPWLYLKGISTGQFGDALQALLGPDAPGLSPSTISRLKESWDGEYEAWSRRDLSGKRYVYFWADGVYPAAKMEESGPCLLVVMGALRDGTKELVAVTDGVRESEASWSELLTDLKRRGLVSGPLLSVGDGALGFWKALRKEYPLSRHQRCWVHKTRNVLNKLPKSEQGKARKLLQDIWMASTKADAEKALAIFEKTYGVKHPKAVECLVGDRDELLAFYDFPAEHWKHLRTSNPIESTFATVGLRTAKTKGCLSRGTALLMVFKLCQTAERTWRKLDGSQLLAEVIDGVQFVDGVREAAA